MNNVLALAYSRDLGERCWWLSDDSWIYARSFNGHVKWLHHMKLRMRCPVKSRVIDGDEALRLIKTIDVKRWTAEDLVEAQRNASKYIKLFDFDK